MGSEEGKKRGRGMLDFLRARGRLWLLVGGVIAGVFLLLVGSGFGDESEEAETSERTLYEDAADLNAYKEALENELEKICESVAGVSQVEVIVTLESGSRVIYATDEKGEPATVGSGSSQEAVYRTLEPPGIAGVGVVCKGGDNAHIQKTLTDLLSTSLGITSNRVCVVGK